MLKVEKLNEEMLESVTGGGHKHWEHPSCISLDVSCGVGVASLSAALGCGIASCVYLLKANKAKNGGNISEYNDYIKKTQNCITATTCLTGVVAAGLTANKVSSYFHERYIVSESKKK